MKSKFALWAALSFFAGGCAQQQVNQGGSQDFAPLPLHGTATNNPDSASHVLKRSLGKPIPAGPRQANPEDDSNQPSPDLIRLRKRYQALPI